MSVVVVRKLSDRIEIGADHQQTNGWRKEIYDKKMPDGRFQTCKLEQIEDDFIIGHVGYSRNFYFMRRFLETTKPACEDESAFTALYQEFLDYAGKQVRNGDITTASDSRFLVVYGSSVYILSDYRAEEIFDYYALGSGEEYAFGVLYALDVAGQADMGVELAVRAACRHDLYCHEPVTVYSIDIEPDEG